GLLHIFLGEQNDAKLCLSRLLDIQDENNPVYWFAKGMLISLDSKSQDAIDCLEKGIELNKANAPLNEDMRKYIDALSSSSVEVNDGSLAALGEHSKNKLPEAGNKFLLTNYKDDSV
ncbi:MAG: hypothetical protein K0Q78_182, partial [Cellvibrio sp.]|nr:hypothetical protein [Cellvibrio sp.]